MPQEMFRVKDSGARVQFAGGMVRDTQDGKNEIWRVFVGPLVGRLGRHLTTAAAKYPDVAPGTPNWTLAAGPAELHRFRDSAARHFWQWMCGETDEDHFAATVFNMNGAEYVRERLRQADGVGRTDHPSPPGAPA